MKTSTKFWSLILSLATLILIILSPDLILPLVFSSILYTILFYVLVSVFGEKKKVKKSTFGKYNLCHLIRQFNNWLNSLRDNKGRQ